MSNFCNNRAKHTKAEATEVVFVQNNEGYSVWVMEHCKDCLTWHVRRTDEK